MGITRSLSRTLPAACALGFVALGGCGGGGGGGGGGGPPPPNPPPPFHLIAPNGGEAWVVGSQRTVSWSRGTYTGLVDVDLSRDGGATWEALVLGTPNDGSVVVTVPDAVGPTTRIQVSAADDDPSVAGIPSDGSDGNFAISAASFVETSAGFTPSTYFGFATGDFDGDGVLDVVLGGDDTGTRFLHGAGDGTFLDRPCAIVGVTYASVAAADFDGDGDLDVAISGYFLGTLPGTAGPVCRVYRNDGHGAFTDTGAALQGAYDGCVSWGDFDGDGDPDLLVSGNADAYAMPGVPPHLITGLYRNDGGGAFSPVAQAFVGLATTSAAWGDFDRDGDLDLVVAGSDGVQPVTTLYRNDGGGVFADAGAGIVGVSYASVSWGDMDRDGDVDLAISGYSATGAVTRVYRNDAGTLVDAAAGFVGTYAGQVAWADYDGDGDLDLAVVGTGDLGPESHVYRNDGTGLVDAGAFVFGGWGARCAWGDFDRSGLLDLLVCPGIDLSLPTANTAARLYRN